MRRNYIKPFGEKVARARARLGFSQSRVAADLSISRTYLSQIENGAARNVTYRLAMMLQAYLGFSEEMPENVPPALACYAEVEGLSSDDVRMLINVKVRGRTPETIAQYRFIHKLLEVAVLNADGVTEP